MGEIQQEFEHIRKRCWDREYFSITPGNITEDLVMAYLDRHIGTQGFSHSA